MINSSKQKPISSESLAFRKLQFAVQEKEKESARPRRPKKRRMKSNYRPEKGKTNRFIDPQNHIAILFKFIVILIFFFISAEKTIARRGQPSAAE